MARVAYELYLGHGSEHGHGLIAEEMLKDGHAFSRRVEDKSR